uniref:Protein kinase domain-containing protein n=1 Tax=Strigops habroptila TaxID=2489341 RepID=A0A672UA82_STRHB
IHDVIGTPANKTLDMFKQSRLARFDFSFKKGKGIPPVVHSLPPKGFSLLYAVIKYDPDERIATHQALQHPYCQELWVHCIGKVRQKSVLREKLSNTGFPQKSNYSSRKTRLQIIFCCSFNLESRNSLSMGAATFSTTLALGFINGGFVRNSFRKNCTKHQVRQ